jgi:hypothetical protein
MRKDVQDIFKLTPHDKQVMMFSATLSKEIRPVCKKFMQDVMSLMASTTWIWSLFFILLKFSKTFLVVSNAVVSSIFTSDRVSVYALLFICPILLNNRLVRWSVVDTGLE